MNLICLKTTASNMSDKEKIKELEDKIEKLENEIASIKDYIDMQDGYSDDFPSAFDSVN